MRDLTAVAARPISFGDLLALTKPKLSRLVVMTTGIGLWIAPGPAELSTALWAIIGTVLVVAGANALNSYLERDVDGLMSRTADRPLPTGRLDPEVALWMGLGLSLVSVPLLSFVVGPLPGLLAAVALAFYVLVYTPLKRRTAFSTVVGAIPGAIPPVIGWTAATGSLDAGAWVLFAILFFWQLPHFYAISLFRRDEYDRAGFRVMPLVRGEAATRSRMLVHSLALLAASLLLYPAGAAGTVYLWGAAVLGAALVGVVAIGVFRGLGNRWARRAFHGTLLYLTALMAVMVIDSLV